MTCCSCLAQYRTCSRTAVRCDGKAAADEVTECQRKLIDLSTPLLNDELHWSFRRHPDTSAFS